MKPDELNTLDRARFLATLGAVFEASPWVAEEAWDHRPFSSLDHLASHMITTVQASSRERQLALLRAHPDLGTRAAVSPSSSREQSGAGLTQLTQQEFDE